MKHSLQKYGCPLPVSSPGRREGNMYGMLLESIQHFVCAELGENAWRRILDHAGCKNMVFNTHDIYNNDIMLRLANSCYHVTNTKTVDQWMSFFGTCFVDFCAGYGYDKLLRVAGRHYRDFLHGIDNIHEMIRFSYPQLQSPSFIVISEDKNGCVLLYQSKRHGFKHYVIGQLKQSAKLFYKVNVTVTIQEEVIVEKQCHVKFRLDFDNSPYQCVTEAVSTSGTSEYSSISGDTFFKVFPFCIAFDCDLYIKAVGNSMAAFLKGDNLIGCRVPEKFHLRRPLIPCTWHKILAFQRVIFELEYCSSDCRCVPTSVDVKHVGSRPRLLLRGQMKYIEDWDMMAFLCTPLLNSMEGMEKIGLYINDMNMYDNSRQMVMAGWQHASQLECSIEQQQAYSEKIEDNLEKVEDWKRCSDALLYSMIPRSIAERLKNGEDPINTCEIFENVTIMFNYMVDFSDICAQASALQIVECMNGVFTLFDSIVDKYDVFKTIVLANLVSSASVFNVETLGDAVYMVAGGVPDRNPSHAVNVAGLALDLQEQAQSLRDPLTNRSLRTRIGMHTGSVVGGVVGRKMPQYCLFGDTVNTAARMQSYSLHNRIHISEPCNDCLKGSNFVTLKRGKVNVKGKGEMRTFWLAGRQGEERTSAFIELVRAERCQVYHQHRSNSDFDLLTEFESSYDNALDLHSMHATTSFAQITSDFSRLSYEEDGATPVIQSPASDCSRSPEISRRSLTPSKSDNDDDDKESDKPPTLPTVCPFAANNHKLPLIICQNGHHQDDPNHSNGVVTMDTAADDTESVELIPSAILKPASSCNSTSSLNSVSDIKFTISDPNDSSDEDTVEVTFLKPP